MKTDLHRTFTPAGKACRGFTLVEVAIALVLLALASATVVAVLRQQVELRKVAETDAILARAHDALLAYVTSYGRLPCPAIAATFGRESAIAGTPQLCTVESGFLPAVTLGMPNLDQSGLLESAWHDGAGNSNGTYVRAIRYSVASLAGTAYPGALTTVSLNAPNTPAIRKQIQATLDANNGLFVCYSSAGLRTTNNRCGLAANNQLAPNMAAIIWSLGSDAAEIANYSTDERQNYTPTVPRVVVSHSYVAKGVPGGPFDDQVSWISFAAVADRLLYAGFVQ
jgi:prepilin-type N-terminal cleavage/methylation domain-containing protein